MGVCSLHQTHPCFEPAGRGRTQPRTRLRPTSNSSPAPALQLHPTQPKHLIWHLNKVLTACCSQNAFRCLHIPLNSTTGTWHFLHHRGAGQPSHRQHSLWTDPRTKLGAHRAATPAEAPEYKSRQTFLPHGDLKALLPLCRRSASRRGRLLPQQCVSKAARTRKATAPRRSRTSPKGVAQHWPGVAPP